MRKFDLKDYSVVATTDGVFLPGGDFLSVNNLSGAVIIEFFNNGEVVGRATVSKSWDFDFINNPLLAGRSFTQVKISTASGTVTCSAAIGEGVKASSKESTATVTPQAVSNQTTNAVVPKADTETLAVAARSGRRLLMVQNLPSSTGDLWTGGAVDTGLCLKPGMSTGELYRDYSGALTLYSEGSTDIAVEEIY